MAISPVITIFKLNHVIDANDVCTSFDDDTLMVRNIAIFEMKKIGNDARNPRASAGAVFT